MGQMIDSTSLNSEQFSFYLQTFLIFEHSVLKFLKIKGGGALSEKKIWKKCLMLQKNRLEKVVWQ